MTPRNRIKSVLGVVAQVIKSTECRFKNAKCHYCSKIGHLEAACIKKKRDSEDLKDVVELRQKSTSSQ